MTVYVLLYTFIREADCDMCSAYMDIERTEIVGVYATHESAEKGSISRNAPPGIHTIVEYELQGIPPLGDVGSKITVDELLERIGE